MMTGRLAELFIDLSIRGDARVSLLSMKRQVESMDRSLANSGKLYNAQTSGKLVQMAEISKRQRQLFEMDAKTYGSSKYAKVADLRAQTDSAGELAGSAQKKATLEAQIRELKTPSGQDIANKNYQNERLEKQKREIENYRRMVAENGRVSAALMRVRDRLSTITTASTIAFGSMTAGISGAVAAASPDVWNTFTGSIRLLTAEIGTIFVPLMIDVARVIQRAANWVRELSPEVRGQILSWATWGLAITGVLMVVPRVITAITSAISVFRSLSTVLSMMGPGMLAAFGNPVVLGVLAVAAAVAGLVYWMNHLATANKRAIEAAQARTQRLQSGGALTTEDFESLSPQDRQRILAASPGEARNRVIDEMMAENQRRIEANSGAESGVAANVAATQQRGDVRTANLANTAAPPWWLNPGGAALGSLANSYSEWQTGRARQPAVTGASLREQNSVLQAAKNQGVPGTPGRPGGGDPLALSSNFQAQFTSFDEGWRRIQQQAASGGALEDRMYRISEEQRNYLRTIAGNTTPGSGAIGGTKP